MVPPEHFKDSPAHVVIIVRLVFTKTGGDLICMLYLVTGYIEVNKIEGNNLIVGVMNYGMGYNNAYVNETMVVGGGRPYYNQPMIVQPSPQVVIVEDPYMAGQMAGAESACLACCCL